MYTLNSSVEIAAPPNVVREKFLEFSQLPAYSPDGFFKSISPVTPNNSLERGVKLNVVLALGNMEPTISENSPNRFAWTGTGLLGTFSGEHSFHFDPSSTTPGGTTFTQQEVFTGSTTFLIGTNPLARLLGMREKTIKGWESYNQDLKKWCEAST